MNDATILLIGRLGTPYIDALQKRYDLRIVSSGKQAIDFIGSYEPNLAILDAVSMRTPGARICKMLRHEFTKLPLVHIHPGPSTENVDSPADVLFVPPFTARRLINSVERLLKEQDEEILNCGPFTINVPRRVLIANGEETQLNPKQASLLELFFRHPNEIIERKRLMETVWKTEYLGDTRTLDVHIRWVRQALEGDGKNPRYLKTVRGVGYRLEIS